MNKLILALVICAGLSACGNSNENNLTLKVYGNQDSK